MWEGGRERETEEWKRREKEREKERKGRRESRRIKEKRKSIEKYKILKIPLAEITDKSLTFSNRAQKSRAHAHTHARTYTHADTFSCGLNIR